MKKSQLPRKMNDVSVAVMFVDIHFSSVQTSLFQMLYNNLVFLEYLPGLYQNDVFE